MINKKTQKETSRHWTAGFPLEGIMEQIHLEVIQRTWILT